MYIERKEDLSVMEFLKNSFAAYPFVNIVDGFPLEELEVPTIAVEAGTINALPFEIGNRDWQFIRQFHVDIFAVNKSQKDEFAYKIINELKNKIPVYDFDITFTSPPQINTLEVTEVKGTPIFVDPELVTKLHFRYSISFVCYRVIV